MIKVNLHLVEAIVQDKKQNLFRYYIAAHLFDKAHSGWFQIEDYVNLVSIAFNIRPKTVHNQIYKMVELGWGSIDKKGTRFFYVSQDKIAHKLYVINFSPKAAYLDWEHIGRVKDIRAILYATLLTHKKGEKTIARNTIQQLTGHAKRTQRIYEKYSTVGKRFNYAAIGDYENVDQLRDKVFEEHPGVFVANVPGFESPQIVRQIPNTYFSPIRIGKRQYNDPNKKRGLGNNCTKIYYDSQDKIRKNAHTYYLQSEAHEKLWTRVSL